MPALKAVVTLSEHSMRGVIRRLRTFATDRKLQTSRNPKEGLWHDNAHYTQSGIRIREGQLLPFSARGTRGLLVSRRQVSHGRGVRISATVLRSSVSRQRSRGVSFT